MLGTSPHDSRRYHRRAGPAARAFSKNEQSSTLQDPFAGLGGRTGWALSQQQIQPLIQGLGLGTGRQARRLQHQIESGQARGPLADAIRSIQQFAPDVLPQAQEIGARVAREGEQAAEGLQTAIRQAQGALPRYQQAADKGLSGAQQGLTGAQGAYGRALAQLPGLQAAAGEGLAGTQEALRTAGRTVAGAEAQLPALQAAAARGLGGAEGALELAQRYAERAASPIGQQDLYNVAARRVLQQVRPGLAARGLEAGGAGAQLETEALRNLTFDFAQRRGAEQQQTLQSQLQAATGVQEAAGRSAQLPQTLLPLIQGLTGAGQGVGQAALTSGQVGQSILPYLSAITQGATGLGQAAGQGAQLASAGVGLAGQQADAVQRLGQALLQGSQIPMQQAGSLLNLLTAGTQPGLSLLGQTGPIPTTSGKGFRII